MNHPSTSAKLTDKPLVVEEVLKASIERVYNAWTRPEILRKWFGPTEAALVGLEVDLRIGGHIVFEFSSDEHVRNAVEGRYLEIEPLKRLTFSWCHVVETCDGRTNRSPESRVVITFEVDGPHTKIRLVHHGVSDAGRETVGEGWASTIERCAAYLAEE
tara:strand:+ start:1615 stop:2091 length:477 start_codon:yes stop_codon:yes gene_type:complete